MLSFLFSFCLSSYNICFFDKDNSLCPNTTEKFDISAFSDFASKKYPNEVDVHVYLFASVSTNFPIEKFENSTDLNFYGHENKYKLPIDSSKLPNFKPPLYFEHLTLKVAQDTQFNVVRFIHTTVVNENEVIITPLKANNITIDPRSLVNVGAVHADVVDITVLYFASSAQQTFYVHGNKSLKVSQIFDGPLVSFYGDSLVFNQGTAYFYINTAYWYGSISVSQPNNTQLSLQYLMANMTLKDRVINYEIGANSTLNFTECIWPSLDRVRVEVSRKGNATIILSAFNIPLFIKGSTNPLTILTNSSELAIPGLNISTSKEITIGSLLTTPTVFTIGTLYCLSDVNIVANDPNMIIVTQINGKAGNTFEAKGAAQWALMQFPPVIMRINLPTLNTIYGSHRLVIPFSMEITICKLVVDDLNGSLQIYPNIIGNPTDQQVDERFEQDITLFTCKSGLHNVTLEFNTRGLRGFTEGTNIYDLSPESSDDSIIIRQSRHIYEVNDHFCIAENETYCPDGSTFVEGDNWLSMADHEIAEMTFYVFNSTTETLNFNKFDHPVVNFIGYNHPNVSITGESIEYNISYLVANDVSFIVVGGPEAMTLGYSADLVNTQFDVPFEFVDEETYNFNTDFASIPSDNVTSHLSTMYDIPADKITLNSNSITLYNGTSVLFTLFYEASIATNYKFIYTAASKGRTVQITKGEGSEIPYQIEIAADEGSAEFIVSINQQLDKALIKFTSFGSTCTLNAENPPVSFADLLDEAVIKVTTPSTYFNFLFDASAAVTIKGTYSSLQHVIFADVILPSNLIWKTENVDIAVQNVIAVGGPSHYDNIKIDGNLTFYRGPALSVNKLSTNNARLIIPYSFNAMPQINFTSNGEITFDTLVMKFVPPIDENVFVHRNIKLYEDSTFDILCGNFNCDTVVMDYQSEIKYFNGSLCAFVKSCVKSEHGQCLRIWFDSERDPSEEQQEKDRKKTKMTNIIIGVVVAIVVIIIAVVIGIFQYKKRAQMPESLTSTILQKSSV
ncbi:hypothetical protein TRFO_07982 [Tritrichomonas foetus]|uniref:Uncharacterized protein n=1 Tax=Tritrichomonas foetus TaxID=1144522 RepID=A0A1J4JS16_9EUKA|nr:hypothetical protein TRFO_07982 [Tritrichomonas foetus]|eukprot:OHT00318.1 hypothetical protein TRFO_07982 [Tritrichomonas foetus]